MLGLKRGMVSLQKHNFEWEKNAKNTIDLLKFILQNIAIDIQHVGSTSIKNIYAKPIIDIAVGVKNFEDVLNLKEKLEENNIIYRGSDQADQLLFVMGDFNSNTRTHHIHIVKYKGQQ